MPLISNRRVRLEREEEFLFQILFFYLHHKLDTLAYKYDACLLF
jgi:hypothetical protein